jgi:hypothetical protein
MFDSTNTLPDKGSRMEKALMEFHRWFAQYSTSVPNNSPKNSQIDQNADSISPQNREIVVDFEKKFHAYFKVIEDFKAYTSLSRDLGEQTFDTELSSSNESIININKSFHELITEGPKNEAERKLLNAVDILLSPEQKQAAISSKAPLGAVVKMVETVVESLEQNNVINLLKEQRKKNQEIKQDKAELRENDRPDKKMSSLGEEYGVLHKIVESIREKSNNLNNNKENSLSKTKDVKSLPNKNVEGRNEGRTR